VNDIFAPDAFAGKVILVTGGSRGIGRAIVLAFAALGGQVIFCYRTDQNAAGVVVSAAAADSLQVAAIQADVGDRGAVDRMVESVYARDGRIDVLVNNAGIFPAGPVRDMSDEIWDQVLHTNLYSVFYCCRAVLPGMINNGGGVIVNMASVAGQRGSALHAHYAAAKGGVLAFTRSLAREVSSQNIRVNAVSPGRIATDLLLDQQDEREHARWMADTPARRLGAPEDVAAAVLFLASPAAAYMMGETLAVNGGLLMD
jgi:3-oxoacyl-[acyl-carrier protein] reductase